MIKNKFIYGIFSYTLLLTFILFPTAAAHAAGRDAIHTKQSADFTIVIPKFTVTSETSNFPILPGFQQKCLENGIRVLLNENPGSGIVGVEVIIKVGAMEQMNTFAGMTSMIQNLILKSKFNWGVNLQESLEADGCRVSAVANQDYARISMICTKDVFARSFKKLAYAIKNPCFEKDTVEEEKERLAYAIENNITAYESISEIFLKNFYRFYPYRQPAYGSPATLRRITPESVKKFYDDNYCSNRMTVAISGDFYASDAMKLVNETMSDIPRKQIKSVDIPWEPVGQEKKLSLATVSNTAWIYIGFPAPDLKSPYYPKMLLLSTLLGEGLSSRLFIELREKEGLCYELSADYPKLEGPSYMVLYVVTSQKNLYQCRKKIFKEINKIKKELVTPEELEAARRKVLSKFLLGRESNNQQAFNMAFYSALGLSPDYEDIVMRRIETISPEDIRETAKKYFENYTTLIIESVNEDYFNANSY